MLVAVTREVSPGIGRCELTHLDRTPIDYGLARVQHRAYEDRLSDLGVVLVRLPADPELPDSVFVEDTCVVFDEAAVLARPGAASRREEVGPVAQILRRFRELHSIEPPGTLDGGDVLALGRMVYVGLSRRTNRAGAEQLRTILAPLGYSIQQVEVAGCLHLKSAVSQVAERTLLLNSSWVDPAIFDGWEVVEVDADEPFAANAVFLSGVVIHSAAFARTQGRLAERGIRVEGVDITELAKAEGGVTCGSVRFQVG
ncbi:MAG: dimethylarginine dimethylaminohydrolase family protein [Gemmataceae bacterium]